MNPPSNRNSPRPVTGSGSPAFARGRLWRWAMTWLSNQPLDVEEQRKRLLFGFLALLVTSLLTGFGIYHLLEGPRTEGIVDLSIAVFFVISLFTLRRTRDGTRYYRGAALLCGLLFIYFGSLGAEHGDRALWVFTYPAFAFFIAGIRHGSVYSAVVFTAWLGFFLLPTEWTGAAPYSVGYMIRFCASYLTIAALSLFFEHVRLEYFSTLQRYQERLQQDNLHLEAAERMMRDMALIDDLTGVANRRAVLAQLEELIARASETGEPLSLGLLDIDHFKRVNDTHGHVAGDVVLVECTRRIGSVLRGRDQFGRFGGEEFLLLLPDTSAEAAATAMERVRRAIAGAPVPVRDLSLSITASIGFTTCTGGPVETESLLDQADGALYAAKASGRDRVCEHRPDAAVNPTAQSG